MKHALHLQTETIEGLRVVTADVNRRVCAVEQRYDHGCAGFVEPERRLDAGKASAAHATNSAAVGEADGSAGGTETSDDRHREEAQRSLLLTVETTTPALSPGLTMPSPGSSKWSQVVKKGPRKRTEDSQQGLRTGKSVLG
ncbi:C-type mannose receptor 2-like [Xyrichtys novacula]|uniref:C-type mannose receptor 2-like n=1 Tax=Xyrichtys novacula TaxID=13765 RepID=A0AAV1H7X2_XYRNO|nr:C-type mannose receptor 2-like [Xyrichtys novacula]